MIEQTLSELLLDRFLKRTVNEDTHSNTAGKEPKQEAEQAKTSMISTTTSRDHKDQIQTTSSSMRLVRMSRTPQLISKPTPPGETIDSGLDISNAATLPMAKP